MRIGSLVLGLQAGLAVATVPGPAADYRNQNPILPPHIPQGKDESRPIGRKHEFVSILMPNNEESLSLFIYRNYAISSTAVPTSNRTYISGWT